MSPGRTSPPVTCGPVSHGPHVQRRPRVVDVGRVVEEVEHVVRVRERLAEVLVERRAPEHRGGDEHPAPVVAPARRPQCLPACPPRVGEDVVDLVARALWVGDLGLGGRLRVVVAPHLARLEHGARLEQRQRGLLARVRGSGQPGALRVEGLGQRTERAGLLPPRRHLGERRDLRVRGVVGDADRRAVDLLHHHARDRLAGGACDRDDVLERRRELRAELGPRRPVLLVVAGDEHALEHQHRGVGDRLDDGEHVDELGQPVQRRPQVHAARRRHHRGPAGGERLQPRLPLPEPLQVVRHRRQRRIGGAAPEHRRGECKKV